MKRRNWLCSMTLSLTLLAGAPVSAQDPSDDHAAVWSAVEALWSAEERGDATWVDTMVSADFMGWQKSSPAPRSKASLRMWTRFNADQNKGMAHELYPLSIVVHGDIAVAHYLYTAAVQTRDKQIVTSNGRYTDVLVRDGTSWKFLSWHGGDNE